MSQRWGKVGPTLTPVRALGNGEWERGGEQEQEREREWGYVVALYVTSSGEGTVVRNPNVLNSQFSVSISSHGKCGHEQQHREEVEP